MVVIGDNITTRFDTTPLHNRGYGNGNSRSLDWFPMDTEELFDYNLKEQPDNKSLLHYQDNPISYKLNEYGFRADSFKTKEPGNVFLGCSHTFGIGHYLENTWSYKVNKQVGGKFYNLSSPGSGIQTAVRLLQYWSKVLNIKNIFHYQPIYHRYEFYKDNDTVMDSIYPVGYKIEDTYDKWDPIGECLLSNYNIVQLHKVNMLAIDSIAKSLGINYYAYIGDNYSDEWNQKHHLPTKNSLQARDLAHFNVKSQNSIKDKFTKQLK